MQVEDHVDEHSEKDRPWIDKLVGDPNALFALAVAFLTGCQVWVGHRQWRAIREANKVAEGAVKAAEQSFLTAQRPWIAISSAIKSGLRWDNGGAYISLEFAITNIGKDPAFDVRIFQEKYLQGIKTAQAMTTFFANEVRKEPLSRVPGHVVFPNETINQSYEMWVQRPAITCAIQKFGSRDFQSFVVVCVDYKSPVTKQQHRTIKAIFVTRKQPLGLISYKPIAFEESLGIDELDLFTDPAGTIAD